MDSSSSSHITTLNNGVKMPNIGLGTFESIDPKTFTTLIRDALDIGYRHFDTALFYENHKILGDALQTIYKEGKYKREDIFITTKYFPLPEIDAYSKLKEILVDLQTSYVDQFLIHWPSGGLSQDTNEVRQKPHHISWAELEKAVDDRLTRTIGVSNFNVQSILNILSFARIKPAVNQIEFNTYYQPWNLTLFCQRAGIAVVGYSSLKGGVKQTNGQLHEIGIFEEPIFQEIAAAHKATIAQICLKFLEQHQIIIIPKSVKKERLQENFDSLQVSDLTPQEIAKIKSLNTMKKLIDPTFYPLFGNTPLFD